MENTVPNFIECVKVILIMMEMRIFDVCRQSPFRIRAPILCGNGKTNHLGIFNVIFYQDDDGSIQTLHSDLRPYKHVFEPMRIKYGT